MPRPLYAACWLTPAQANRLHLPGGEEPEALHLTLCFIGDLDTLPGDASTRAGSVLRQWAAVTPPIRGTVSGVGVFVADPNCLYASVDAPALPAARQRLWDMLAAAGLEPDDTHGFTPHITLAYFTDAPPAALDEYRLPCPLELGTVALVTPAVGEAERDDLPLAGTDSRAVATIRKRAYPVIVRSHVRGNTLPTGVAAELARYFHSRPGIRAAVAAKMGYDPLTRPAEYIAHELSAPEHATLRGKPLTVELLTEWERQEDAQSEGIAKDQPAAGDVHVDTASNIRVRRRRSDEPEDAAAVDEPDETLSILKADDEKRIVYGIVLEPDVEDSQGDVVSKEDVELACHRFLYNQTPMGVQHSRLAPEGVRPVECYIAPTDFTMGGQTVRKGSWVLATHVPDDALWAEVKKGQRGAYSVAGSGRRTPA